MRKLRNFEKAELREIGQIMKDTRLAIYCCTHKSRSALDWCTVVHVLVFASAQNSSRPADYFTNVQAQVGCNKQRIRLCTYGIHSI